MTVKDKPKSSRGRKPSNRKLVMLTTRATPDVIESISFISRHPDARLSSKSNQAFFDLLFRLALEHQPWKANADWEWVSPMARVKEVRDRLDLKTGVPSGWSQLNIQLESELAEAVREQGTQAAEEYGAGRASLATFLFSTVAFALKELFVIKKGGKLDVSKLDILLGETGQPPIPVVVKVPSFVAEEGAIRQVLEALQVPHKRIGADALGEKLAEALRVK
jgi:hypothetical protein